MKNVFNFLFLGYEQHYNPDSKVTVTTELLSNGNYIETWTKDGYSIVTKGNRDDITTTYPGGKQINVSFLMGKIVFKKFSDLLEATIF